MRCPALKELPPPPPGKTGWPWTEEAPQLPDMMLGGSPWPRVSIVTPSYNQGEFIEETIRSVLLQGYPNLEYIIIDGGSTDRTLEIIHKYERGLAYWTSEPDRGQSDAINKGFQRATGEFIGWLCSDDVLLSDAVRLSVDHFIQRPDVAMVCGDCHVIDETGAYLHTVRGRPFSLVEQIRACRNDVIQPGSLMRRTIFEQICIGQKDGEHLKKPENTDFGDSDTIYSINMISCHYI